MSRSAFTSAIKMRLQSILQGIGEALLDASCEVYVALNARVVYWYIQGLESRGCPLDKRALALNDDSQGISCPRGSSGSALEASRLFLAERLIYQV
jgi:hypothetical protein